MNRNLIIGIVFVVILFGIYYFNNLSYINMRGHDHPMIYNEEQFIFEMIPHHREAVETSKYINLVTENTEIKELTQNIIEAQELEIDMMNGWIDQWYPNSEYISTYENMMPELRGLDTKEAEKAYLKGMIVHHAGAVMMAEQLLSKESKQEVKEFAQRVINVQNNEIKLMKNLLKNY